MRVASGFVSLDHVGGALGISSLEFAPTINHRPLSASSSKFSPCLLPSARASVADSECRRRTLYTLQNTHGTLVRPQA